MDCIFVCLYFGFYIYTYVNEINRTVYTMFAYDGIFLSATPLRSKANVYGNVILLRSPTYIPRSVKSQPVPNNIVNITL